MLDSFGVFTLVSLAIKIIIFVLFVIIRYKLYILSFKLPGPIGLPVLGNLPSFFFKKGTFFKRANDIIAENKDAFRFWIGMNLLVVFKNPEHIEKILTSSDICKGSVKSFVRGYSFQSKGNDEKWRSHKKDMKLLMNPKFFTENMDIFQKHMLYCMGKLEEHVNKEAFDIHQYIHPSFIDIFGELILGNNMGAQTGKNQEFIKSIDTSKLLQFMTVIFPSYGTGWRRAKALLKYLMVEAFTSRINQHTNKKILFSCFHLWLWYKCTKYHRETKAAKQVLNEFIENVIIKSWERRKFDVFGENSTGNILKIVPIVDQIGEYVKKNPNVINKEEYRDYLKTFFISSEKTVSIISSFCCVCFGMYPEYQHEAVKEINAILKSENGHVKFEEVNKLKYLDMCVQEVLRLVTLRPYIMRRFSKTFLIDNLTIPPYCDILIPLYVLNRDPKLFVNPEEFHPDHFLPEAVKSRNYNYTFGVGPRECMGKTITMLSVKIMLVNILRRYVIEADGKFEDIQLKADPFTSSINGYKVRLKTRT